MINNANKTFIDPMQLMRLQKYPIKLNGNPYQSSTFNEGCITIPLKIQGRIKEMEQPKPLHRGRSPHRNSKGTAFRLFLYIRVFSCVMNTRHEKHW